MDTVTTVASMLAGFKTAFDLNKAVKEADIDQAVKEKAVELTSQLFELQNATMELDQQNQQLKQQIRDMSTFSEEIKKYKLIKITEGLIFHKYQKQHQEDETPVHVICPNCVSNQKISILQIDVNNYICPSCDFTVFASGKVQGSIYCPDD